MEVKMNNLEITKMIIDYGKNMLDQGLTRGTVGNISYAPPDKDYIFITPSGVPYREIQHHQIPRVDYTGKKLDPNKPDPSSETPMHTLIYKSKESVNAIVHTHSPFASTIATIGKSIPPIYYLIANIGDEVPLAEYETYGTKEIAEAAIDALGDRKGVLLEKNGALSVGEDLESAYEIACLIEELAMIYYRVLSTGVTPEPLEESEVKTLQEKFQEYGQFSM